MKKRNYIGYKAIALWSLLAATLLVTSSHAQDRPEPYWFYAKPDLAKRKIIPVKELTACMLGDTLKPSVKGKFKSQITATALNQSRLLQSGTCDVALAFDDRPDGLQRITRDQTGFAIYKISGDNLELIVEPVTSFIAVGRMELAAQETLEKKNLRACGEGSLTDAFRPNPRVWKDWSNWFVKFDEAKTPKQIQDQNQLNYNCDVWIMTPDNYKSFAKTWGTKYPLFDTTPADPVLRRRR